MSSTNEIEKEKLNTHFLNLFSLAICDSNISAEELELLYHIALENGVSTSEIDFLIENPHKVKYAEPQTNEEFFEQLYNYCRMILADNKIDIREISLFKTIIKNIQFSDADPSLLLEVFIDSLKSADSKEVTINKAKAAMKTNA